MRLSAEQALQDDNRFANCNALAELKYCGWEIPQRRAITNDEIRFYAWLCRSAVALLKEQEAVEPTISGINEHDGHGSWWYQCGKCKMPIDYGDKFCRHCGRPVMWDG